jgi:ribosomal protein S18 acetylase RimI-like enzyme
VMLIRLATSADLTAIARIQEASPQASQWEPKLYLTHRCVVAEVGCSVGGFLVTRETAPGEREILNLAVDPPVRRKGVARALLHSAFAGWNGEWFLEVRASNIEAIKLYEALQFQRVGDRRDYYNHPRESAIVMRIFS